MSILHELQDWIEDRLFLTFARRTGARILTFRWASKPRMAYTLVELLSVIVIVSILAALALPTVKNILTERKTSLAAIQVKAFLEAARARAIASGRPVSVVLERLSSRWDGGYSGAVPQSATANNLPSGKEDNFEVYNASIRLMMAESQSPIEIEARVMRCLNDETASYPKTPNEPDLLIEKDRILAIEKTDNRMEWGLVAGNRIELDLGDGRLETFMITSPASRQFHNNPSYCYFSIQNEGALSPFQPYGSELDINIAAAGQRSLRRHVPFTPAPPTGSVPSGFQEISVRKIRLILTPKPIDTMIVDLPRGSCIDLSLSGLAVNDESVNPTPSPLPAFPNNYYLRDCRREFASDWIWPWVGITPSVQSPPYFRPIHLVFSPNGMLDGVMMNGPGASNSQMIEPHSDILLFVGRMGQIQQVVSVADLVEADQLGLATNLTDPTGYWVRISPSSGAISATPAIVEEIKQAMNNYRVNNANNEAIGSLLEKSRALAFSSEGTSQ